ncbi:hypothetical protein HK101_006874 [Irineochytrium annulatum]|nr:hypothetical protein HK101_006874 [Irineochytrium annulatum]
MEGEDHSTDPDRDLPAPPPLSNHTVDMRASSTSNHHVASNETSSASSPDGQPSIDHRPGELESHALIPNDPPEHIDGMGGEVKGELAEEGEREAGIGKGGDDSVVVVKTEQALTHDPATEEISWEVEFPYPQSKYKPGSNYIRTTKYTLLTFIPLNLYLQFKRFYNLYFLLGALSTLYFINNSSDNSLSWEGQVFPLAIVLIFAAAKDAIEDYARYVSDREANNYTAKVLKNGVKVEVLAKDIFPGDIIYVVKGEKFPVDAILIGTSYDDGTCFIETAELDGETNLKRRTALSELSKLTAIQDVSGLRGRIQCEKPNENLAVFNGRLTVSGGGISGEPTMSLSMQNLLLRGAVLRNTDFCWASVVFTGSNTKIIKNLKKAGQKSSRLEGRLNWLVLFIFIYNAVLLFGSVFFEWLNYKWLQTQELDSPNKLVEWYLMLPASTHAGLSKDLLDNWGMAFFTYFTLYTYVIPISLFVTIELARLAQGRFMIWDKKMMLMRKPAASQGSDAPVEKIRMKANNTNLNEELGAVEYIFSDKTGTLTQNEMRPAKWFVSGMTLDEMESPGGYGKMLKVRLFHNEFIVLLEVILAVCQDPSTPKPLYDAMVIFARALALCHGVIPSVDEKTHEMIYESQSPDETALLHGMEVNDVKLLSRNKSQITVAFLGIEEKYEVLNVLDFTSDRKRMSVIVRTNDGIHLYCKGADNIILGRLSTSPELNPPDLIAKAESSIQKFSESGLRTLVIAYTPLTEDEYRSFKSSYDAAEKALVDRERKVSEASEVVERNLRLLGCTAIEDRLQDEVPETIEYLLRCDIRLWLLTGDKQETAINIGMSSRLINSDMAVMILNAKTEEDTARALDELIETMNDREDGRPNALVINGETLAHVFSAKLDAKLLHVGVNCHSVICCRVTPLQKALVVKLVKTSLRKVTLAIGDGANDVSMIQAADVGVGIMGREGNQAVRSSDFSFGEFRFLRRLLAVHGRYNYLRLSQLIYYSFYKNLAMITVQFWFGFYSDWSGNILYEQYFLTGFNVIFTFLPPFFLAIFEQDVDDSQIEKNPELYRQVRSGLYWNWTQKVTYLLSSLWHSLVIYYSVYFMFGDSIISPDGRPVGYWVMVYIYGTPMLLTLTLKVAIITKHWVCWSWFGLIISMIAIIPVQVVIEATAWGGSSGSTGEQHLLPTFWLILVLMPTMALLPDFAMLFARKQFFPSDADLLSEASAAEKWMRKSESRMRKRVNVAQSEDIQMTQVEPVISA